MAWKLLLARGSVRQEVEAGAVGVHSPDLGKSPGPRSCPAPSPDPRKPSQVPNRPGRATLTDLGTSFVLYLFIYSASI